MRNYKWQIFLFALCLGVIFTVSISSKKRQKPKQNINNHLSVSAPVEDRIEKESIETIENKIYNIGYQRGQRAMLIQMEKQEYINKTAEYTVNFEIPEEEKDRLNEIMSKAYVDGYHKAGDMFNCPRQCLY